MPIIVANLDINFKDLREQKHKLLELIWDKEEHPAWGIIELIDEIQDQAIDKNGIPAKEVFLGMR